MDQTLTYDKLVDMIEKLPPPLPFVAFTMSPAAYSEVRRQCKPHPLDGPQMLDGVEVWEVLGQTEDCLQWNDKDALRRYLEYCGVIEPKTD